MRRMFSGVTRTSLLVCSSGQLAGRQCSAWGLDRAIHDEQGRGGRHGV